MLATEQEQRGCVGREHGELPGRGTAVVARIENDAVLLLRRLQGRLAEEGHRVQGEMMGRLAERCAASDDTRSTLDNLFRVHGWDTIALRLMWYLERAQETGSEAGHNALLDYQVDELHRILMTTSGSEEAEAPPQTELPAGPLTGLVFESLMQFNTSLEDLRRTSFEGERFQGMRERFFESALSNAGRLHQVCSGQGQEALAQFAAAFSLFLRYVIERDLFDDARVAHVIDNAAQALQAILDRASDEDYDTLQQTIDMLHNPETLLE